MTDALRTRYQAARALASEAAALAMRLAPPPGAPVAARKGAQDWVTEADRAVERLLRERLASLFPGDGFLGEEDGRSDGGAGGLLWVVDPIDGTSNYARGRARWCVSIGLMEGEAPLLGVLAAPLAGDVYRACRGDGAFLNDRPMVPTACTDPASAMVELSWSPRVAHPVWTAAVGRLLEAGAMPRTEGSGALGLADLASGRLDGFVELSINLWDVAGAFALLAETGVPFRHSALPGAVIAGSPDLMPTLVAIAGPEAGLDHRAGAAAPSRAGSP